MEPIYLAMIAFCSSLFTACAGLGGGILLLAMMLQFFPPSVVIPLHGITQFFSNASRALILRSFIVRGVRCSIYNRLVARCDCFYSADYSGRPRDGFVDPRGLYPRGNMATQVSQAQISPRNDQWGNHWRVGINFGGDRSPNNHPPTRKKTGSRNKLWQTTRP